MTRSLAIRGAASGFLAALVAACYGLVFVEPSIELAVGLEAARKAALGETVDELLTRAQQRVGLVVALLVVGATLGLLYGVVMSLVHRRSFSEWAPPVVWRESARLAVVGWAAMFLLPQLRYPANPPGVGGADTIGLRTNGALLALAAGLFAVALSWRIGALLVERSIPQPWPAVAVAATVSAGLALTFLLLPDLSDPVDIPAALLWRFRITSFGSHLLLFGGMATFFTVLTNRERFRSQARRERAAI